MKPAREERISKFVSVVNGDRWVMGPWGGYDFTGLPPYYFFPRTADVCLTEKLKNGAYQVTYTLDHEAPVPDEMPCFLPEHWRYRGVRREVVGVWEAR